MTQNADRSQPIKIRLVSNASCWGPMPAPDTEIEQRLTLNKNGQCCFSSYTFGDGGKLLPKCESMQYMVSKDEAKKLLNTVSRYFDEFYREESATDVGCWTMEITNAANQTKRFTGSLCGEHRVDGAELSELIRNTVGMNNLFALNGLKKEA